METIINYLESMFKRISDSPEASRLKKEILSNLEEKYEELKRNGKSEHEAIGIIISEFGNIDELLNEVERDNQSYAQSHAPNSRSFSGSSDTGEKLPVISLEEVREYLTANRKMAQLVGAGVFLIIFGASLMVALYGLMPGATGFAQVAPVVLLLVMIGAAVGIFIYSDQRMEDYKFVERGSFYMTDSVKNHVEQERKSYQPKGLAGTIAGVCLCIFAPLIPLTGYALLEGNRYEENYSYFIPSVMIAVIAAAVFILIYSGTKSSAYDKLLKLKEFAVVDKQRNKVTNAVASIIFPLATAIFLFWGFVFGDWHISWVVFPCAGILYGILCGVYQAIKS